MRVDGLVAGGPVTMVAVIQSAPDAFTVVFTKPDGNPGHLLALRAIEQRLKILPPDQARATRSRYSMNSKVSWATVRRSSSIWRSCLVAFAPIA
jgi:hypothetical protein